MEGNDPYNVLTVLRLSKQAVGAIGAFARVSGTQNSDIASGLCNSFGRTFYKRHQLTGDPPAADLIEAARKDWEEALRDGER